MQWAMGSLSWTSIGTTLGGGVSTLGGGVTILGVGEILGCRSVNLGCVRLNMTSRIDWAEALRSDARAGLVGTLVVVGSGNVGGGSMAVFRIQLLQISRSL